MTQSKAPVRDTPQLVRAAQAGSHDALDELIAEHLPLIYNIIGRALGGHPDVDDLVQDTMLRAIRGLPALREPERFRSWLITIAYRQIQLHLRARMTSRHRRVAEPVEEVPDPLGDFAERATAELVVDNQRRELVEAANWLDEQDRRLLGLWWQEAAGELSRGELASALKVKPKHAAVRIQRMKAQLDVARSVVGALRARPRCPDLADHARRWNGVADPLWRKRLVRHVRDCPQCVAYGSGLVAPEQLLLGVAALPVPAVLVAGLLPTKAAFSAGTSLLAQCQAFLQNKGLAVAAAGTVAVGSGLAYAVHYTPLPATPPDTTVVLPTAQARSVEPGTIKPSAAPSAVPTPRPVVGAGVQKADLYVAPNGSDTGDGTAKKPYKSLNKAVAKVRAGQTIALRGGTYRLSAAVEITTNGTAAKRITLSNYRDERPVLDAAALPAQLWAITQQTAYWTVQGLEVINSRSHPYVCRGCRDTVFRRMSMHDNTRSGLLLRDPGTTGNQVLDSDFFDNDGIGLGIGFGSGAGNLFRGNRAYRNYTGGIDLGSFTSPVTLEYNWAYRNNATGFILGGGTPPAVAAHKLRHNAAWDNASHGFADDGNTAKLELSNNTAFRNKGTGISLPAAAATVRSNVAIDNGVPVDLGPATQQSRNSWQQDGTTFRSTDPASAEGPRTAAGRTPRTGFLTTGDGTGASMTGG